MRVPSPQQIQYLNPLDGHEVTIQKNPNPTPHHVLSERFKKSNSFEKEASGPNAKIDKNEIVNEDGKFENSEMEKVKIQYFNAWENYLIIF